MRLVTTHPQLRSSAGELGHVGSRRHDLLEVVEQEQHLPLADQRDDALENGALLGLLYVEGSTQRRQELGRLGHVGETDEGSAVGKIASQAVGELGHQTRLADAARPRHGHDPVVADEFCELPELAIPAQERRARLGHRGPNRCDDLALSLEHCAVGNDEARAGDRVKVERPAHVLEAERPQRRDIDPGLVLELLIRSVGHEHGAGDGERLDPRGNVHRVPGQPFRLDQHIADVNPDPHGNVSGRELALHRHGALDRCERAREHREAAVAETLHDRSPGRLVLALERGHVPVARLDRPPLVHLHERRIADHVREHHGDQPALELLTHHARPYPCSGSRSTLP